MTPDRKSSGITPAQNKKIHALKNALGLDDAVYREILAGFGVSTSRALTFSGGEELIERLERDALEIGAWRKIPSKKIGTGYREGFATPKQLDMIAALWAEVSTAPADKREAALRKFVTRQAKVTDLRFLRAGDASRVICALKAMNRQAGNE